MITIIAATRVAAESHDAFVAIARATIDASRVEEGCLHYSCSEDLSEPGTFRWIEQWRDIATFNAHAESLHHLNFLEQLADPQKVRRSGSAEGQYLDGEKLSPDERLERGFSPMSAPNAIATKA